MEINDKEKQSESFSAASEEITRWLMHIADLIFQKYESKSPDEWPQVLRPKEDLDTFHE